MDERLITAERIPDDGIEDQGLRPRSLSDYIGQEQIKKNLAIFITAAKKRGEALDHILFCGPPGLGKTTLSNIIAQELKVSLKSTSGPAIEKTGDLAAILTDLEERDVLFIDEIHRLNHVVEEILYPAMEDFQIDIIIGQGPSARTMKLPLKRFTLIGATTRAGLLTSPLRDRFGVIFRLEFYTVGELNQIVLRGARILNVPIQAEGALEIAKRSRGTPRIAIRLLHRVRDFAQVSGDGVIDIKIADYALEQLGVDKQGLDRMDRAILHTIIQKFDGGPVGIETLSAAIGEEKDTIIDLYEPYLIQEGYLQRTPRGRMATSTAYGHLGIVLRKAQGELFPEI